MPFKTEWKSEKEFLEWRAERRKGEKMYRKKRAMRDEMFPDKGGYNTHWIKGEVINDRTYDICIGVIDGTLQVCMYQQDPEPNQIEHEEWLKEAGFHFHGRITEDYDFVGEDYLEFIGFKLSESSTAKEISDKKYEKPKKEQEKDVKEYEKLVRREQRKASKQGGGET